MLLRSRRIKNLNSYLGLLHLQNSWKGEEMLLLLSGGMMLNKRGITLNLIELLRKVMTRLGLKMLMSREEINLKIRRLHLRNDLLSPKQLRLLRLLKKRK